jgi:hypothetical protein
MLKKIKVKVFEELRKSLKDALAFERGRKVRLRVSKPQLPRQQEILSLFGEIEHDDSHDYKRERRSKPV